LERGGQTCWSPQFAASVYLGIDMNQLLEREIGNAAPGAAIRLTATVIRLHRFAADVTGVGLALPSGPRFRYQPGQYVSVLLGDGERRSFSMASAYKPGASIELHVRHRAGGRFSETALRDLKVGHSLELEGPFGQVQWRQGLGPAILMGTGTGVAPLKALLEHGLIGGGQREMWLYWGGRALPDLYLRDHFHTLAQKHPRMHFIPVLSRPDSGWAGRRGYVQDVVAEDFADLHNAHIYACGSGIMIDAARARLATLAGFDEDRFFCDSFEPAFPMARKAASPTLSVFVTADRVTKPVRVAAGVTLLSALKNSGLTVLSVCGGKASCGTCKVNVVEGWRHRLPGPERTERRLLANLDHIGPGDRLACQIHLTQDSDGLAINVGSATWPLGLRHSFDQLENVDD
jgi:CDP-4-dehydro-6-deoxyglucose reductase